MTAEVGDVVQFQRPVTTDSYYGGCPHCGQNDGYLNDGRDHWFFCDHHKAKWLVGSNLFSSWREEDDEVWRRNRFRLAEYITVRASCFQQERPWQ